MAFTMIGAAVMGVIAGVKMNPILSYIVDGLAALDALKEPLARLFIKVFSTMKRVKYIIHRCKVIKGCLVMMFLSYVKAFWHDKFNNLHEKCDLSEEILSIFILVMRLLVRFPSVSMLSWKLCLKFPRTRNSLLIHCGNSLIYYATLLPGVLAYWYMSLYCEITVKPNFPDKLASLLRWISGGERRTST